MLESEATTAKETLGTRGTVETTEEAATETMAEGMSGIAEVVAMDEMEAEMEVEMEVEIGAMTTEGTGDGMEDGILTAAVIVEEEATTDETAMIDAGTTTASANPSPRFLKRTSPKLLQQQPRRSTRRHIPASP